MGEQLAAACAGQSSSSIRIAAQKQPNANLKRATHPNWVDRSTIHSSRNRSETIVGVRLAACSITRRTNESSNSAISAEMSSDRRTRLYPFMLELLDQN